MGGCRRAFRLPFQHAQERAFNPEALAKKPLRYEKLDQLVQELLLGVR
jgi:hypothetical protein